MNKNVDQTILSPAQIAPHDHLAALLADELRQVDALIAARMASQTATHITQVASHIVKAGGKRLRPMLTLATAKMFDYSGPYHIHLAATVEFIHTATLLHDDVVDNSQMRRGRPTANMLWNNQSSVLVGDYLFARSFQLMLETHSLQVLDILANASATISEGEVLQLSSIQDPHISEEVYFKIIRGKTAALFAAATQVGAVIAGQGETQTQALYRYGDALGIAFQIADDLLDYIGKQGIGKNIGDDFREGKMTLPLIKAVGAATAPELEFWTRVIGKKEQEPEDFARALEYIKKHGALDDTRNAAIGWSQKAKAALQGLPASELRKTLEDLADYVVGRLT